MPISVEVHSEHTLTCLGEKDEINFANEEAVQRSLWRDNIGNRYNKNVH
jgi:hypothetical protein